MRSWALAALPVVAGCSQIFGLEPPELADAGPPVVTGRFYIRYAYNDSKYEPVFADYVPPVVATLLRDDGTKMPLALGADGSVSFVRATESERYRVRFEGDGSRTELQHVASHFDLHAFRGVRPDATVASAGTTLTYNVGAVPLASQPFVFTTGQWMFAQAATLGGGVYQADWSQGSTADAKPTLLQTSAYDRVYLSLMVPEAGEYLIADRYRLDSIDMVNGTDHMIAGAATLVARNACMRVEVPAATELMRQDKAGFVGTDPVYVWMIESMSSPEIWWPLPFITIATGIPTDIALDVMYGNPFPGEPMLRMTVGRAHDIASPSGTPIQGSVGTTIYVRAQPSCATPTRIEPSIALPSSPSLDGVALASDGMSVTIDPARPAVLGWQRTGGGRSDFTWVTLYEVTDVLTDVMSFITVSGDVRIDPALFKHGTSYVFGIAEQLGSPNAASGDTTHSQPTAQAYTYSSTFVVK